MDTTPRYIPAKVIAVNDIPYTTNTKSGKAVTNMIHDEPVPIDALANPLPLKLYKDLEELKT